MEKSDLITITYEDRFGNWHNVQFDAVSSFNSNDTSTVTTYPTSKGTPVADNVYRNPRQFTCSISVGVGSGITDEFGSNEERPRNAHAFFANLKELGYVLQVETRTYTYDNMVLTDISTANNNTTAYNFNATIKFTEVPRVGIEYTTVQVAITSADTNAESEKDKATLAAISRSVIASIPPVSLLNTISRVFQKIFGTEQ